MMYRDHRGVNSDWQFSHDEWKQIAWQLHRKCLELAGYVQGAGQYGGGVGCNLPRYAEGSYDSGWVCWGEWVRTKKRMPGAHLWNTLQWENRRRKKRIPAITEWAETEYSSIIRKLSKERSSGKRQGVKWVIKCSKRMRTKYGLFNLSLTAFTNYKYQSKV